jgi:hypothetical protein
LTWEVDKVSGLEGHTTQLKEWSAVALLVKPEKEEDYGTDREDESKRSLDFGSRPFEDARLEEAGVGST